VVARQTQIWSQWSANQSVYIVSGWYPYHKGAYFQEGTDDQFGTTTTHDIYKRDFSEATGEDRVDKSTLPQAGAYTRPLLSSTRAIFGH
jgi:hypothetical protein